MQDKTFSLILTQLSKVAELHPDGIGEFLIKIAKIIELSPDMPNIVGDAISDGQLISKQWLADNLVNINLGTIFLCGGWLATLLLDQRLNFYQCISFDIDPACKKPAEIIHRKLLMNNWKFLAFTKDIFDLDYTCQPLTVTRANGTTVDISVSSDTIINTSCEHISDFPKWWDMLPMGKLIAVQSNNGFNIPGHVNCVASLNDFAAQTPMTTIVYEGEKEMPKFVRYMRIGYK